MTILTCIVFIITNIISITITSATAKSIHCEMKFHIIIMILIACIFKYFGRKTRKKNKNVNLIFDKNHRLAVNMEKTSGLSRSFSFFLWRGNSNIFQGFFGKLQKKYLSDEKIIDKSSIFLKIYLRKAKFFNCLREFTCNSWAPAFHIRIGKIEKIKKNQKVQIKEKVLKDRMPQILRLGVATPITFTFCYFKHRKEENIWKDASWVHPCKIKGNSRKMGGY